MPKRDNQPLTCIGTDAWPFVLGEEHVVIVVIVMHRETNESRENGDACPEGRAGFVYTWSERF